MMLQIVVTPECFGCGEASRLAALMRRDETPQMASIDRGGRVGN